MFSTEEYRVAQELIAEFPDRAKRVKEKPMQIGWFIGRAMQRLRDGDPQRLAELFKIKLGLAESASTEAIG